ncbi:MAG: hypothetical protein K8H88_06795 [Sandaracinaceae bacterium]|nr:hypothetical protein [Sandaracinaceae bacterium]
MVADVGKEADLQALDDRDPYLEAREHEEITTTRDRARGQVGVAAQRARVGDLLQRQLGDVALEGRVLEEELKAELRVR